MNPESQNTFYNIGISYKKADTHMRGKFSLSKESQISLLEEAKKNEFKGIFVLSTCNRTEISGLAAHPYQLIKLLCKFSEGTVEEFAKISTIYKGKEAIHHIFRIGTGLESQILGDYEIVGQLRQAFKLSQQHKTTNAYIERLLNNVMQASKKVKNDTKVSSGTTSVSYAAVQYIISNIPNYDQKNILVYGLGKMGKHTCKNLAEYTKNKQVSLINRTEQKASDFVKEHPSIRKSTIENLDFELKNTDILVVSTSSDKPTISLENMQKTLKEMLILDLSIPENVAKNVGDLPNITLVNVDELSKVTDKTLALRKKEIPAAENIIEFFKNEFNEWLNHRKLTPAINVIKESLKTIQKDEINFHKKKFLNFDEEQAEIITSRIIQKITTQFVKHLKDENTSISESIHVIKKVFQS